MLVLKRSEGQWIDITHKSGDQIRIRVYHIRCRFPGQLDMAFEDGGYNFTVERPERSRSPHALAPAGAARNRRPRREIENSGCCERPPEDE